MNCPKGELILVISVINFMLFTSIETVSVVLSSQHDLFTWNLFVYLLFVYLFFIYLFINKLYVIVWQSLSDLLRSVCHCHFHNTIKQCQVRSTFCTKVLVMVWLTLLFWQIMRHFNVEWYPVFHVLRLAKSLERQTVKCLLEIENMYHVSIKL